MKLFEHKSPLSHRPLSDPSARPGGGGSGGSSGSGTPNLKAFNLSSISKQLHQLGQWKKMLDQHEQYLHQQYWKTQHQSNINNQFHQRQLSPASASRGDGGGGGGAGVEEVIVDMVTSKDAAPDDSSSSSDAVSNAPSTTSVSNSPNRNHQRNVSQNQQIIKQVRHLEQMLLQLQHQRQSES